MSHQHVPSSLYHQSNKGHTGGKHDSKGSIRKRQKGKVAGERVSVKAASKVLNKKDKKAMQQQANKNKKMAVLDRKRFGTLEGAPKTVALIALGEVKDIEKLHGLLLEHCGKGAAMTFDDVTGPCTVPLSAKQRMTLINVPRDVTSILDMSKVADILLLVVPAEEGIDEVGEKLISLLKSQGLPNVFGIIEGLDKVPEKNRHNLKKDHIRIFNQNFPEEPRVLPLDSAADAAQVIRFIENCTIRTVHWREKRPYMLVDHIDSVEKHSEFGTVRVSGYLRGGFMSANQLVHIPGVGDFQLKKIEVLSDPNPIGRPRVHNAEEVSERKVLFVDEATDKQESLVTENTPDLLLNEQTWPTPDELSKSKKRLPKGTSSYQAAWIDQDGDEERGDEEGDEEGDDNEGDKDMADDADHQEGDEEEGGKSEEEDEEGDDEDEGEDDDEEGKGETDDTATELSRSERSEKAARQEEDLMFPDEVECPLDTPARTRFQKYRGLKSFRTTEWDPKENLPLDYARIFQFSNFSRSSKNALDTSNHAITAGTYITLHIVNVPLSYVKSHDASKPRIIGGLFKYENKMSVLQFNILKHPSYEEPVQSKDSLIFHVGLRRYTIEPVFSTLNPGCAKQKFERFLQPGRPSCATVYGPITFPPHPLLVFNQSGTLVATGTLHAVDPDRIVVKKIILTGTPAKVHKKTSTIRDMFYFPEDANWFKPVELWTKGGHVGHIKESVGTHGLIKCTFDMPVNQNDTVCLSLYKRVFPKWPKSSPSVQYPTEAKDTKMDG